MVLLDDARALAQGHAAARLWRASERVVVCRTLDAVQATVPMLQNLSRAGKYVVVALSYELGMHLQGGVAPYVEPHAHPPAPQSFPYLVAWVGGAPEMLDEAALQTFMHSHGDAAHACGSAALVAGPCAVTQEQYRTALNTIRAHLEAGDSYQINYTLRQDYFWQGHPVEIYAHLRRAQPVPFGACLQFEDQWVLSCSPELLVRREGPRLTTQPMKGTARADPDARTNARIAQALRLDSKNRSENVMIVDLLRNDLGRVALVGSVRVPTLFKVEQFGQVWQMTSTIEAQCDPAMSWWEILRHLFPCGSVTGAPKRRAMQIIRSLEPEPRGLYCGALGWVAPNGDFCFSVPIRTLQLAASPSSHSNAIVVPDKVGTARMSVGSGIVLESQTQAEWQELETKRRFAKAALPSTLGLIETMRARWCQRSRTWRIDLLDAHLARLCRSALQLGWSEDVARLRSHVLTAVQAQLSQQPGPTAAAIALQQDLCLRLQWCATGPAHLATDVGNMVWELQPYTAQTRAVALCWAADLGAQAVDPDHVLLRHKTTWRRGYQQVLNLALARGCWDAVLVNTKGELCEGTRSNVLLDMGERTASGGVRWLTPPLTAGLLPGVWRGELLAGRLQGVQAREASLTVAALQQAQALAVCNALHGLVPATLRRFVSSTASL